MAALPPPIPLRVTCRAFSAQDKHVGKRTRGSEGQRACLVGRIDFRPLISMAQLSLVLEKRGLNHVVQPVVANNVLASPVRLGA